MIIQISNMIFHKQSRGKWHVVLFDLSHEILAIDLIVLFFVGCAPKIILYIHMDERAAAEIVLFCPNGQKLSFSNVESLEIHLSKGSWFCVLSERIDVATPQATRGPPLW